MEPKRAREIVEEIAALAKEAGVTEVSIGSLQPGGIALLIAAGAERQPDLWAHGGEGYVRRDVRAALTLDGVTVRTFTWETRKVDAAALARALDEATRAA